MRVVRVAHPDAGRQVLGLRVREVVELLDLDGAHLTHIKGSNPGFERTFARVFAEILEI